jgi:hypothetical protein
MKHRSHGVGGRSVVNAVHLFAVNQAFNLQLQGAGGKHVEALLFLVACSRERTVIVQDFACKYTHK